MEGADFRGILLFVLVFRGVLSLPEQGVWEMNMSQEKMVVGISKSMYNGSTISLKINCKGKGQVEIGWVLRETMCAEEYIGIEELEKQLEQYYLQPYSKIIGLKYKVVDYKKSPAQVFSCNDEIIHLEEDTNAVVHYNTDTASPVFSAEKSQGEAEPSAEATTLLPAPTEKREDVELVPENEAKQENINDEQKPVKRSKRDVKDVDVKEKGTPANPTGAGANALEAKSSLQKAGSPIDHQVVTRTWKDGIYLFILKITPVGEEDTFNATVNIWMQGKHGYLSAMDWPLLPFYATMCVIYVIYGLIWLALTFCNWRDLLRIQFWIGGVIVLGMLEKAVFFSEYESINSTGRSVRGAVIFAELVSCMKRTLARMLVVIVSLGFGIVKPRLGPMLHRVLGMGALYFILGSVEGCLRVLRAKSDPSNQALLAAIPLAVLDAAICWWVFTSLVNTTRTLRLRRNLVKLSLYRHFTNTLIFAVLASVAFMIWSIKQHKLATCLTDWKEIWVDEAFWHLLFSVILMVIMILWRPTNNNQRYAFSPLLDAADDDEDDEEPPVMNDAFEDSKDKLKDRKKEDGMKMRGGKSQSNGSPKSKEYKNKAEDDLKWIEENIPTSVTDTALPSLLDSDEEIMTTKFEMSKME